MSLGGVLGAGCANVPAGKPGATDAGSGPTADAFSLLAERPAPIEVSW